ncbi:hypothetical protein [Hyalangium versicolor]|uniref:hypothetical protein n=1 Tax=Hyalangium versicolor TaxID=2861190 RepID=UPI001CCBB002|nr:hypothetical protein [Hyalangium versicolor]
MKHVRTAVVCAGLWLGLACGGTEEECPEGQHSHGDGECHTDTPVDGTPSEPSQETGYFATQVRPLLDAKCVSCHGPQEASLGLVLGPASKVSSADLIAGLVNVQAKSAPMDLVEPGEPARSWIIHKVTGDFQGVTCNGSCGNRMPPTGTSLTAAEIDVLRTWITSGADAK